MSLENSGPFLRLSVPLRLSGTKRELLCKTKKLIKDFFPGLPVHMKTPPGCDSWFRKVMPTWPFIPFNSSHLKTLTANIYRDLGT